MGKDDANPGASTGSLAKLEEWLRGTGFPLEMRVAAAFRRAEFGVTQSYYYDVQDRLHEADVIAWRGSRRAKRPTTMYACVECVRNQRKPWVVLTAPLRGGSFGRARVAVSIPASSCGEDILKRLSEEANGPTLLAPPTRVGYNAVLGYEQRDDNDFPTTKKLIQAVSAANAKIDEAPEARVLEGPVVLALPTLVLDADLYEASLDDAGAVTLEQVEESTIIWLRTSTGRGLTCVRLVTLPRLDAYIRDLEELFVALTKAAETYSPLGLPVSDPRRP